jgi:hypothetical protein
MFQLPKGTMTLDDLALVERRIECLERGLPPPPSEHKGFFLTYNIITQYGSDALYQWWKDAERRYWNTRVHTGFKYGSTQGIDAKAWLSSVDSTIDLELRDDDAEGACNAYGRVAFDKAIWLLRSKPLLKEGCIIVTPLLLKQFVLKRFAEQLRAWTQPFRERTAIVRQTVANRGLSHLRYADRHEYEVLALAHQLEKLVQPEPAAAPNLHAPVEMAKAFAALPDEMKDETKSMLPSCVLSMIDQHRKEHSLEGGNTVRFTLTRILRNIGVRPQQMLSWLCKGTVRLDSDRATKLGKEIAELWKRPRHKFKYGPPSCSSLVNDQSCPVQERCRNVVTGGPVKNPAEYVGARIQIVMDMSV